MNTPTYASLGEHGCKCHHMPEDFYDRGLKLIAAEQRAYRKAFNEPLNKRADAAWRNASKRLNEHINSHNTH